MHRHDRFCWFSGRVWSPVKCELTPQPSLAVSANKSLEVCACFVFFCILQQIISRGHVQYVDSCFLAMTDRWQKDQVNIFFHLLTLCKHKLDFLSFLFFYTLGFHVRDQHKVAHNWKRTFYKFFFGRCVCLEANSCLNEPIQFGLFMLTRCMWHHAIQKAVHSAMTDVVKHSWLPNIAFI